MSEQAYQIYRDNLFREFMRIEYVLALVWEKTNQVTVWEEETVPINFILDN